MNTPSPHRIALLLGGDSPERRVSLMSGRAVWQTLVASGHGVTAFDLCEPATRQHDPCDEVLSADQSAALQLLAWADLTSQLVAGGYDVVLPLTHGGRGENGVLQALLEVTGIPFVGSDTHACALAMDKAACKAFVREVGVPSARGVLIPLAGPMPDSDVLLGPCVVKPSHAGSSVGVTIFKHAPTRDELREAIRAALVDGPALVEEFVPGVEVTCVTLGEGAGTQVLPIIEIVPEAGGGFYDFEAKYAPGGSRHLIPPRLSESVQQEISEFALRAHRALGCRDVTRSDFIVTPNEDIYFLELNTLPGMTDTSLVPDAARATGVEFPQLLDMLLAGALRRAHLATLAH